MPDVLPPNHRGHCHRLSHMFINPMWDNESQRIGKKRCTPTGYALHGISDLIGFIALILLPGVSVYLMYAGIRGQASWGMLWLFVVPFAIAIVGNMLHTYSWHLADKRQFKYDYGKCVSTWIDESGAQHSYKYGACDETSAPADVQ